MIIGIISPGSGLGDQLFSYIATRVRAADLGVDFGFVGKEFDAIVSGVSEWGVYVEEVETKAEGMVKLRDMKDDFYELNEKLYAIVGKKTGKKYSLGDKVQVKLISSDPERKTLDFQFV